jgi:hypothetical protein
MSSMIVMILIIPSSEVNQFWTKFCFYLSHPAMKPRIIFKFLSNFPMIVPILLQVLRQISSELTMLFLYHV